MKKVFLLVGSIVLACCIAEVALRWLGYDTNAHPHWIYNPVLGWVVNPSVGFDQVNPSGFRHATMRDGKPPGLLRAVILGDSFALGTSLDYAETFPGVLEQRLSKTGEWEVISLAVDDWGTAQELIALEEFGLDLDPDVVVLQLFPFNDFCNNCLAMAYTCSMQDSHRPYFVFKNGELEVTYLSPWRHQLRDRLRLFGLIENWWDDPWARARRVTGDDAQFPELRTFFEHNARMNGLRYPEAPQVLLAEGEQQQEIRQCWFIMQRILTRMSAQLAKRKIPFIAVVVPFLYTFDTGWPELEKLSDAPMDRYHATEKTEAILDKLAVTTISMRDRINSSGIPSDRYFISRTDGHFNQFGHAQVADWVYQAIQEKGLGQQE